MKRLLIGLVVVGLGMSLFPTPAYASTACTGSVNPTSVAANGETSVDFSLTNTGSEPATYVELYAPNSDFTIVNYGVSGWTVETSPQWAGLSGNTVASGGTFNFSFGVNTGPDEKPSANWSLAIYTSTGYAECTEGPFGMEISGTTDSTAPTLSEPAIGNTTTSSVNIGWTSNEASDSQLRYGLSYGSYIDTLTDATLTTSHTVGLTGLSANTTYYFEYRSVDASGNASSWKDFYTFTTSPPAAPTATTAPGQPTNTPAPSATPTSTTVYLTLPTNTPVPATPTPVPDTVGPTISFDALLQSAFVTPPQITGKVTDKHPVSLVQYQVDGGQWQDVNLNARPNVTAAAFGLTPLVASDGVHQVVVRATDSLGNVSTSVVFTYEIDTSAPTLELLTQLGEPVQEPFEIRGMAHDNRAIGEVSYSLDGGASFVLLDLTYGSQRVEFGFTPRLEEDGNYPIVVRTVDDLGNETVEVLGELVIDKLPPDMGLSSLYYRSLGLVPAEDGAFDVYAGESYRLVVSAIGGPIKVYAYVGERQFPLEQRNRGYWSGDIQVAREGVYEVEILAVDGAGNQVQEKVMRLSVTAGGMVSFDGMPLAGVRVQAFAYSDVLGRYIPWNGAAYGSIGEATTDENGYYGLTLAPGSYYLELTHRSMRTQRTRIFEVDEPYLVRFDFVMRERMSFGWGTHRWYWPYHRPTEIGVVLQRESSQTTLLGRAVGATEVVVEGKRVTLDDMGSEIVVAFLGAWMPSFSQQLEKLKEIETAGVPVVVVMTHTTQDRAAVLSRSGDYGVTFYGDPYGEVTDAFGVSTAPVHVLVQDGVIASVSYGMVGLSLID